VRQPKGRPKGARDRRSNLRYGLLKEVLAILKTLATAAKGGDIPAAKLILERTLPALKSAAEPLTLPGADTPASQGRTVLRPAPRATSPPMRPGPDDRTARRADKIRARLGWEPGILNGEGGKPKWCWRTFERLAAKHDDLVGQSMQAMMLRFRLNGTQP